MTTSHALQRSLTFRPLARDDLPLLHAWIGRPHVAEWWDAPTSLQSIADDYLPAIDGRATTRAFIVERAGAPVGFIQVYVLVGSGDGWWPDERDPGARGIDQFIADADQLGQGLGTAIVRAFVDRLFLDPAVTSVQVDPSPANGRAIGCYKKAGFASLGEVATPDGPAILMRRERERAI